MTEFDKLAEKYGVIFENSGRKIPFTIREDIFQLILLHYFDVDNIQKNANLLINKIIELLSSNASKESIKSLIIGVSEKLKNLSSTKDV